MNRIYAYPVVGLAVLAFAVLTIPSSAQPSDNEPNQPDMTVQLRSGEQVAITHSKDRISKIQITDSKGSVVFFLQEKE